MAVWPRWAVRCTARSRRNGFGPCGAWACSGQFVCSVHGGRSPNGLAAGQERLAQRERDLVLSRMFRRFAERMDREQGTGRPG
jgi:hypothetical protein